MPSYCWKRSLYCRRSRQHEAQLVDRPEGTEAKQRQRCPEVPQAALGPHAHPRRQPLEQVPDAELLGERDARPIRGEEVVVEGLQRLAADLEDASQASGSRIALAPDPVSLLGEA
jgi:hypothetical protein